MSSLQLDNTVSSWLDVISEIIKQKEYPRSHKNISSFSFLKCLRRSTIIGSGEPPPSPPAHLEKSFTQYLIDTWQRRSLTVHVKMDEDLLVTFFGHYKGNQEVSDGRRGHGGPAATARALRGHRSSRLGERAKIPQMFTRRGHRAGTVDSYLGGSLWHHKRVARKLQ